MQEKKRWIACPFCLHQYTLLHSVSEHLLENHLDELSTDYDAESKAWSYWKIKEKNGK